VNEKEERGKTNGKVKVKDQNKCRMGKTKVKRVSEE
jgi:hypothetical protein